jgi:hypothetical protein
MRLPRLARALGAAFILCAALGACGSAYNSPYAQYDPPGTGTAAAVACANIGGANNGGMRSDYLSCVQAHR